MTWVNDGLPFLTNSLITEYDIQRGNTSMMREYQLADEDTIRSLEQKSKGDRNKAVGIMQIDNKTFANRLEDAFNETVKRFIKENALDMDVDVLAIRRDAVFVVNHPITKAKLSENVHFVAKNKYHAALQLGPLEFYFRDDGKVDIKNFVQEKKDINNALQKLEPGMISFLQEFIEVCESCNMDLWKVYKWLQEFCTLYKEHSLDIEYYREFTREATFRVIVDGEETMVDFVPESMIDDVDITYNFRNIIIPLLQVVI